MATVTGLISAMPNHETLLRLGAAMQVFVQQGAPIGQARASGFLSPEDALRQRMRFSEQGVSVTVKEYTHDGIQVTDDRAMPFSDLNSTGKLPEDATTWTVDFEAWVDQRQAVSSNRPHHLTVRFEGPEMPVTLAAEARSQNVAMEMLRAATLVLKDYPIPIAVTSAVQFKVFVAFGGGRAWEVVRDYLKRADILVDAFTETERAGAITLDVVSEMIRSASMAVIVMTAADEMKDGTKRARQNVIHEAGFSQGVLGTRNTIILLERGVDAPTNIAGVTYIPFNVGEIHTTEDRVVALIRDRMDSV